MTYDNGEGSPKVVQETPFPCQLLRIAQLRQSSFILNLEVDLGRRHDVVLVWLCGRIVNVLVFRLLRLGRHTCQSHYVLVSSLVLSVVSIHYQSRR